MCAQGNRVVMCVHEVAVEGGRPVTSEGPLLVSEPLWVEDSRQDYHSMNQIFEP